MRITMASSKMLCEETYTQRSAMPLFENKKPLFAEQLIKAFEASRAYSEFVGLRAGCFGLFQPAFAGFNDLKLKAKTGEIEVRNLCGIDARGRVFYLPAAGLKPKRDAAAVGVRLEGGSPSLSVDIEDGFAIAKRQGGIWQLQARLCALAAVSTVHEAFNAAEAASRDWRVRLLDPSRISDRNRRNAAAIVLTALDTAFAPDADRIDAAAALDRLASLATVAELALEGQAGVLEELKRAPGPFLDGAAIWLKLWTEAFPPAGSMGRLLTTREMLPGRMDTRRRGPRGQVTTIIDLTETTARSVLVNFEARPDAARYAVVFGGEAPDLRRLQSDSEIAGAPGEWKYRIDVTGPGGQRARELHIFGPAEVKVTAFDM
jgi:hypothetical protein